MNRIHNLICSSDWWARGVEGKLLPWALEEVDLGDDVLEFGPGYGATTRVLTRSCPRLTVLELDPGYCRALESALGAEVEVRNGDATAMPFDDSRFSTVLCFTMLHHIATPEQQDQALREAARVLRPGGVFAGTDSVGRGLLFRAIHVGDTLNLIDPETLGARLERAGLARARVETRGRSFRFRARKPA